MTVAAGEVAVVEAEDVVAVAGEAREAVAAVVAEEASRWNGGCRREWKSSSGVRTWKLECSSKERQPAKLDGVRTTLGTHGLRDTVCVRITDLLHSQITLQSIMACWIYQACTAFDKGFFGVRMSCKKKNDTTFHTKLMALALSMCHILIDGICLYTHNHRL